jgi:fluoride exporter
MTAPDLPPSLSPAWLPPRGDLAIAAGAVLGAGARAMLTGLIAPLAPDGLPLGTLAVNLLGCLLIGLMQTLFLELLSLPRELQLLVSVGFLGGLTTFSSVSVELVRLIQGGSPSLAALYLGLSLLGGAAAALLGSGAARLALRAGRRR